MRQIRRKQGSSTDGSMRSGDAVKAAGVEVPVCHCSNSAGIVELPDFNMDAVRAGITIYGMYPSDEVKQDIISLKPAMALKSFYHLHQGDRTGNGGQLRRNL